MDGTLNLRIFLQAKSVLWCSAMEYLFPQTAVSAYLINMDMLASLWWLPQTSLPGSLALHGGSPSQLAISHPDAAPSQTSSLILGAQVSWLRAGVTLFSFCYSDKHASGFIRQNQPVSRSQTRKPCLERMRVTFLCFWGYLRKVPCTG